MLGVRSQKMSDKFYVYQLRIEDFTTPFYIGKGCGKRAFFHLHECSLSTDSNKLKVNTIRKAYKNNKKVLVEFVKTFMNENDAYELEKQIIAQYGRIVLNTGCLTNLTEGGLLDKLAGYKKPKKERDPLKVYHKASLETRLKMSIARKGKKHPNSFFSKMVGRKHSEETKQKISASHIKANTEEVRKKKSIASSKRVFSKSDRKTMSDKRKNKNRYVDIEGNMILLDKNTVIPIGFFPIPSWETGNQTSESIDTWLKSNDIYDWWIENKKGYKLASSAFDINSIRTMQNMINKFKSGWIPNEDPLWIKLLNNKKEKSNVEE